MSPLIVWAGVVALAIICFTIIMVAAVKQMPKRPQGQDVPKPTQNPDEPMYGIKDKDTK